jgi:hypothetical protein
MSGQGKYTVYAPESNSKNILLSKLFRSSPTSDFVGNEVDYRTIVVNTGNAKLIPTVQDADQYLDGKVNLDYSSAPNTLAGAEGVWKNAGDPANSFTPDLTSPGPGKTDGVDKNSDPSIKATDIKPTYVPGGPNTGTKSPAEYAKKIAASVLGVKGKMGSSDSSG